MHREQLLYFYNPLNQNHEACLKVSLCVLMLEINVLQEHILLQTDSFCWNDSWLLILYVHLHYFIFVFAFVWQVYYFFCQAFSIRKLFYSYRIKKFWHVILLFRDELYFFSWKVEECRAKTWRTVCFLMLCDVVVGSKITSATG